MSDVIKIKMFVNTGFAGCTHNDVLEVDRTEWEAMNEKEQAEFLEQCASDFMSNYIEFGAYVDDEY